MQKLDLPCKTPIQPPRLTQPRTGWITPKNPEVDRPDNVTIRAADEPSLRGSEVAHPTRKRINAPPPRADESSTPKCVHPAPGLTPNHVDPRLGVSDSPRLQQPRQDRAVVPLADTVQKLRLDRIAAVG